MSVAGTKNFDQPPHDSNRTHLVFSTSGLLLGSRAPLVSHSKLVPLYLKKALHDHPKRVPYLPGVPEKTEVDDDRKAFRDLDLGGKRGPTIAGVIKLPISLGDQT